MFRHRPYLDKAKAEALPFEDATFDLVTSRIAPHHFESIPTFLDGTRRVLKPGGRFALVDNVVPAGSVGTGFNAEQATALKTKLAKLEQKEPPFANGAPKPGRWSKRRLGEERWIKPTLVAEVEFAEWTPEGHVRHASFISLRADKATTEVVREIGTTET